MSYDRKRKDFQCIMKQHGITHGTTRYEQLIHFLDDPTNSPYLQSYYILCTGYLSNKEIHQRVQDLVAELEFTTEDNYSYRKLFDIDNEWYPYFKENAYPSGQRRSSYDKRRGVDKSHIDRIMVRRRGPPVIPLEDAIVKECELKSVQA